MVVYQFPKTGKEKREEQTEQPTDRSINKKEQEYLLTEAKRTGMNLDKALKKANISSIEAVPLSLYKRWISYLKQRQSLPEPAPPDIKQDIPDSVDGELPWN